MVGSKSAGAVLANAAVTLLLLSGFAGPSHARGLLAPAEQNRLVTQVDKRPMVFFVARGPADSCGPGCGEWIAAEGKFVPGTAQRFREFLATLGGRDLPIFFHSPGGISGDAVQIALLLRERRMTAGVGRTMAEQCRVFAREDPCQRLIASGGEIKARLRPAEGQCLSACVFALVGASNRRISGGSTLGVHSVRFDAKLRQQAIQRSPSAAAITVSDAHDRLRLHFALMGIDPRLQQIAAKVDARRMYVLSRDEITRLGIETGGLYETPWASFTDASKHSFAVKSVTWVMDAGRKEHRTVVVQVRCVLDKPWLVYQRELPSDELGYALLVNLAAGGKKLTLRRGPKKETSELWAIPAAAEFLRSAAAAPGLVFTEQAIPKDSSRAWSREIMLSNSGLSTAVDGVLKSCDGARSPEATRSDVGKK